MAWIADPKALRTYDPERGLELRGVGGGSDGAHDFVIHRIGESDEVLAGFTAYMDSRKATIEERAADPSVEACTIWEIRAGFGPKGWFLKGYGRDESKRIIREAMLAYRALHGQGGRATSYDVKPF